MNQGICFVKGIFVFPQTPAWMDEILLPGGGLEGQFLGREARSASSRAQTGASIGWQLGGALHSTCRKYQEHPLKLAEATLLFGELRHCSGSNLG